MTVNILGILVGVLVSVLVGVVTYRLTRRIRRLTYSFAAPAVVDLRPEVIKGTAREQISADFAGRSLQQLSVIQATVRNEGTEPVERKAIEEPICFSFRPEARVLAAEVIGQSPGVHAEPAVQEGTDSEPVLQWEFRSLDRNEYFTIQFLVEGTLQEPPGVSARILGVPSGIELVSEGATTVASPSKLGTVPSRWAYLIGITGCLAGILAGLSYAYMVRLSDVQTRVEWLTQQERRHSVLLRVLAQRLGFGVEEELSLNGFLNVSMGKELFETKCEICHNVDNTEKKIGPGLKGVKNGKLPSGKASTYENLLDNLNKGGGGMPAFERLLTNEEKENLISFVLTL